MATMTVRMSSINAALLDTFREETTDGLEQLEAKLLELLARPEPELIDQLFRVAHTIKGGAGTFGMTQLTRIAHRMEGVLDTYRQGARPTPAAVTTLLEGTDALRRLLAGKGTSDVDDRGLEARLEAASKGGEAGAPAHAEAVRTAAAAPAPPSLPVHTIRVSPAPGLFRAGADPVMLFDQLTTVGELVATVDLSGVPPLAELDPTTCHLAWSLAMTGGSAEVVHALFGWLDELCPIAIETTGGPPPAIAAPPPTPGPAAPASGPAAASRDAAPAASIRVRLDKLDGLMNLIGDLMTTQSTLCALGRAGAAVVDPIRERAALDELERLTRLLQQSALQLRSMPISSVLNRFPRLVHDLAERLGKQIELELTGDTIELDKTVLERIGDPLVHLLRNSLDHGIEQPDVREAAGKPRVGRIRVSVAQRGDEVTIEIADDGKGLDTARILSRAKERGLVPAGRTLSDDEIHRLILLPGFSTAEQVSDVSGRGVGMDVVVRTIQELGGDLQLRSVLGAGSTMTLRLPLTLAIMDGQLVKFGGRTWVVPLAHVVECIQYSAKDVTVLIGQRPMYRVRDAVVPILDPCERLMLPITKTHDLVLIVEANGQRRALVIDEVGARQQVVVKSLSAQLARVDSLSGAVVLGDGSLGFILDIVSLCTAGADRAAA